MNAQNPLDALLHIETYGFWRVHELFKFCSPDQLAIIAEEAVQTPNVPLVDLIWKGSIPASDQHEVFDLRDRQIQALTVKALHENGLPVIDVAKVVTSY